MAAAHTAYVVEEDGETVIRVSGKLGLSSGPVLIEENQSTGEVTLTPVSLPDKQAA